MGIAISCTTFSSSRSTLRCRHTYIDSTNKNLAIANRSRVSYAVRTHYVEDINRNMVTLKSRLRITQVK